MPLANKNSNSEAAVCRPTYSLSNLVLLSSTDKREPNALIAWRLYFRLLVLVYLQQLTASCCLLHVATFFGLLFNIED
jgi:hypothetical protein